MEHVALEKGILFYEPKDGKHLLDAFQERFEISDEFRGKGFLLTGENGPEEVDVNGVD